MLSNTEFRPKILAITGFDQEDINYFDKEKAFDDYLSKPIDIDQL